MDLETRVQRLERTNRLLLVLLLVTGAYSVIGRASAASDPKKIVADSVETRSLAVVNPYGKQALRISVSDDGMVGLGLSDVSGKEALSLLLTSAGEPSVCVGYHDSPCRIVIGDVSRDHRRELSIQLRDEKGNPIWTPPVSNPYNPAPFKY